MQRLPLDDERLARLAAARDGLRSLEDPTYHALRWPDADPAAGVETLVREAEELQRAWAWMSRPPRPMRPRSRKRRPRRRVRMHLPDGRAVTLVLQPDPTTERQHSEIIWPGLITARGAPYLLRVPTR